MKYFITVLTDICMCNGAKYIIHTKVFQSSYRVEVYKEDVLVKLLEDTLKHATQEKFIEVYSQVHKDLYNDYCQYIQEQRITKDTILHQNETSHKYIKISLLSIFIVMVFTYVYVDKFIYSQTYIDIFFTNTKDKITYMKKIEKQTNMLAQNCYNHVKNNEENENIYTNENCQSWCNAHIIKKDYCALIQAYLKKGTLDIPNKMDDTIEYTVLPKGDIAMDLENDSIIQFNNLSNNILKVSVKKIVLNHSIYEEIVQFRDARSSLEIGVNKSKNLVLFLEPSYYNQFEQKKYEGYIELSLEHGNAKENLIKKFTFLVH